MTTYEAYTADLADESGPVVEAIAIAHGSDIAETARRLGAESDAERVRIVIGPLAVSVEDADTLRVKTGPDSASSQVSLVVERDTNDTDSAPEIGDAEALTPNEGQPAETLSPAPRLKER